MLGKILEQFPDIDLVGCSTAGNFSSGYGFSDDSIIMLAFCSDVIEIGIGVGRSLSESPEAAVESAVAKASRRLSKPAAVCLAFPDGYSKSFDPVMKMLNRALGRNCPVFGGAAGTLWNDSLKPLQFYGDRILTDAMPIMIFAGPLEYSFSIANSWKPIGKRAKITDADDRRVKRIDGLKAVDFYRHYLGDHSEPPREFILAVYADSQHTYLRAPLEYNSDGSITFSESVPRGATVQLTEAFREDLIEDTRRTSRQLVSQMPHLVPAFGMAFSCVFRKDMLGTRVEKELQVLKGNLPAQLPIVGFYSFGEIAPLAKGQESVFHGATLVTLLVGQTNGRTAPMYEAPAARLTDSTLVPTGDEDTTVPHSLEHFRLENNLLRRKLNRSEMLRGRLEEIKDLNSKMHHKIIQEVEEARKEIQRKETLLQKSEEKYRRIVTTAGEGFLLMDENLAITDANEAFCRMLGFSKGTLLGKTPVDLGADEIRKYLFTNQTTPSSPEYRGFEGYVRASNGRPIPILIHGSKLRDDNGTVIGNMAFVTDLTEQKKAFALAAEIQKSLLPQYGARIPGLDVAGKNVCCEEIGGDYFDFLEQKDYPNAPFSIVVGDISGHGLDSALLMTTARAFLRMRASQSGSISDIVTEMNHHLTIDVLNTGRFMTLFYLTIDPSKKLLKWVRAGHDPAVIYDPQKDTFEELSGTGIALGVNGDFRYEENKKTGVSHGQIIALGTDGVWEARNSEGSMFGKKRFREVIRRNARENANRILDAVYDELDHHTKGFKSDDDITLVVARICSD